MDHKRFRILILGAGFSRGAGFPLASELWSEVRDRARQLEGERAKKFWHDLDQYIRYKRDCDGEDLEEEEVDFEDFMKVLDIEHFLGLRGKNTWSVEGNETTIVVKTLIGEILAERTPDTQDVPELYLNFASRLEPGDWVFTFNYDVLLERALEAVQKPFRLFPFRYESVGKTGAVYDDSWEELVVLKWHGSIDWFDRKERSEHEKEPREQGVTRVPSHPVFSNMDVLGVTKLLEGPRLAADPLAEMYRVHDVRALYKSDMMFRATPWLLAPSSMKIVYANKLKDFWDGLNSGGSLNSGMAIIGYSLPPQDDYARQAIYTLVRNYQRMWWDELPWPKSPLVIVDHCQDEKKLAEFKNRYRFVDWRRAVLHVDGLNDSSIEAVFE